MQVFKLHPTLVCECTVGNAPFILLSAFFSFNVFYSPRCSNYFSFLEYVLLESNTKISASVKHFIAPGSGKVPC